MGSGKTSLAKELSEQLGLPIYPLADPIKQAAALLGDPDPYGSGKLRWMQQGVGNLCTGHDTTWFVKLWFQQHPDFQETGAIVDDVRRLPEYDAFSANDFLLVRLDVSLGEQLARGVPNDPAKLNDPTETALDHMDPEDFHLWFSEHTTLDLRVEQVIDKLIRIRSVDAHDEIDALLP